MNTQLSDITINIKPDQSFARVTTKTKDGRTKVKNILTENVKDLLIKSSSAILKDSDTGFISPNLVRESIINGQVRRLYLFPTIEFQMNYNPSVHLGIKPHNKYGFSIREDDEDSDYDLLVIDNYKVRNFGLFIVNANTDEFECARYNFGTVTTDFFDMPTDKSKLVTSFFNHFESSVCWHGSFSNSSLNLRNSQVQSALVHNYLNSNFNNDLNIDVSIKNEVVANHSTEINEFLSEVFEDLDRIKSILNSYTYLSYVIYQYFFATIKGMKLEDYCTIEYSQELGEIL